MNILYGHTDYAILFQFFNSVGPSVTKLPHHLDDISWSNQLVTVSDDLREKVKEVSTSVTRCQSNLSQFLKARQLVHQMQRKYGQHSKS